MENKTIEQQLAEVNEKLDFITEQMQHYQRRQREFEDLKSDLTIIGKDILDASVEGLEDVAPYFDTDDLVHLLKKFLRNVKSISKLFDYMESAQDLFNDISPLGKQVFDNLMEKMDEADKKGYFDFGRELTQIVDTIVTEFSLEDVVHLRENIVSIILTLKSMTQPDMLNSVNNALGFFKKMDIDVDQDISIFQLIKKAKDPKVKKGLYFMLEFVKNMAEKDEPIRVK